MLSQASRRRFAKTVSLMRLRFPESHFIKA